jgi:hypothetical protein
MGKTSERPSAVKVANVKVPDYFADGDNLYFRCAPSGACVRSSAPQQLFTGYRSFSRSRLTGEQVIPVFREHDTRSVRNRHDSIASCQSNKQPLSTGLKMLSFMPI